MVVCDAGDMAPERTDRPLSAGQRRRQRAGRKLRSMPGGLDNRTAAVIGATGFVGGAAAERLVASGFEVRPARAPRIAAEFGSPPIAAGTGWIADHPDEFAAVVDGIRGVDVVVNAAGLASATAPESADLWGANAVLPAILAIAAVTAGVPRFIHVSSAAVQGSQRTLDERAFGGSAHSPYARSKGAGEMAVTEVTGNAATTAVVYRPTSVLGAARPIAARLARVLRSRWLVVPRGDISLPVAHIDNVGAAITFLAASESSPAIVGHPWEGMTTASLASAFGRTSPIRRMPRPIGWLAVRAVRLLSRGGPLAGHARRIELLWDGQGQQSSLPELGYSVSDATEAFTRLGDQLS